MLTVANATKQINALFPTVQIAVRPFGARWEAVVVRPLPYGDDTLAFDANPLLLVQQVRERKEELTERVAAIVERCQRI